jgi:hypothetical protein
MARDNELRWTFSDVTAAANVAQVDRDITSSPFRGGLVTLVTTASQWAVGPSDAMNFTHWRDQIADITNLTTGTPTSAIPGDPVLSNSTSYQDYYLRASVAPIGFVGPESVNLIVQGANDCGGGTSGTDWVQVSGIGSVAATASGLSAAYSTASPTVVTPTGSVPPSGTLVMMTDIGAGSGPVVRTPYVVLQNAATTFTLATLAATYGTGVAINAATGGNATFVVANNSTRLTATAVDIATERITFTEPVTVGDAIVFGSAGSITGLTVGQLYFVTSATSGGVTLATTPDGSTVALGGSLGTPYAGKVNIYAQPVIAPSAGSGTTITTTIPHALEPGQMVVPVTTAGGLTAGNGYVVLSTPTTTTFTVSATIGGSAAAISGTPGQLWVGRKPKIINAQVGMTTRPWLRAAVQQLNGTRAQDGYVAIYNAEISMSRDSAQVA